MATLACAGRAHSYAWYLTFRIQPVACNGSPGVSVTQRERSLRRHDVIAATLGTQKESNPFHVLTHCLDRRHLLI